MQQAAICANENPVWKPSMASLGHTRLIFYLLTYSFVFSMSSVLLIFFIIRGASDACTSPWIQNDQILEYYLKLTFCKTYFILAWIRYSILPTAVLNSFYEYLGEYCAYHITMPGTEQFHNMYCKHEMFIIMSHKKFNVQASLNIYTIRSEYLCGS